MTKPAAGSLYVVSTPIGNLTDMTYRAVEVLSSVALIVAEDTRHSRHLLAHFDVQTPLRSYHEHNEASETPALIERLEGGESVAIISDAGTPLVSDPGARLVAAAAAAGIRVIPIPGASSVLAALVGSGLPLERFIFLGFLERKGRARRDEVDRMVGSDSTVVFFESANRLQVTLAELAEAGAGERRAAVAREITKQFEEFRRGTISELEGHYSEHAPKGEVVIVIEGKPAVPVSSEDIEGVAAELARAGRSPREVMESLVVEHRAPRNVAYKLAHALGARDESADTATGRRASVTKRDEQER